MAMTDHIVELKKGSKSWNTWRKKFPDLRPDLKGIDLEKIQLLGANLENADLTNAKLYQTDLRRSNLRNACLIGADGTEADFRGANFFNANLSSILIKAKFSHAILEKAYLKKANLLEADFTEANLLKANFVDANLKKAKFTKSILKEAKFHEPLLNQSDFYKADLSKCDLAQANLTGANLTEANLTEANLSGSDLKLAYLVNANLSKANLTGVNLQGAHLEEANATKAIFTGAKLTRAHLFDINLSDADITGTILSGTGRDGWIINGIHCDYVFWDIDGKERYPKERCFKTNEFETLYKYLPTVEYVFEKGCAPIDTIIMDRIVQAINEERPEIELTLQSFNFKGNARAVFNVVRKKHKQEAYNLVKIEYERQFAKLEGKYEILRELHFKLIQEVMMIKGEITINEYNVKAAQIGAIGDGAKVEKSNFNQIWNESSLDIDLNKLAEEFGALSSAMKMEAKTIEEDEAVLEIKKAEEASKDGIGPKAIEHAKNAGKWALEKAQEIGTDIAAEVIKKSMGF